MKWLIIGDVHGCHYELMTLLGKSDGRPVIFVGDLVDRGPSSLGVLREVMRLTREGKAQGVRGNHDDKLRRYLLGNQVTVSHGMETTVAELEKVNEQEKEDIRLFIHEMPYVIEYGLLKVVHAAAPENTPKSKVISTALYGVPTGGTDERGLPERADWAESYRGESIVVHGHVQGPEVRIKNKVYNIDTGCVFGGHLTGLLYPEMETIQVKGRTTYAHGE